MAGDGGDAVLELVAAGEVVAVGHRRQVGRAPRVEPLAASSWAPSQLVAQLHHLAEAREEGAEHVPLGGDLVRLAVEAHGRLAPQHDRARVGLELLAEKAEERGLPAAVGRDQGDALAEGEAEGDALEERLAGVTEAQIGDLEQRHRPARRT